MMTKDIQKSAGHTPGPWRMNGPTGPNMQSYSQPFCVAGTGEYASTLIAGCLGDTRGGIEAAEANARLIAAAPELLEVLRALCDADTAQELTDELFERGRNVIAKVSP